MMVRVRYISVCAALLSLSGCGSQKNVTRQEDVKMDFHLADELVRNVSVDTSKSEETTVTITEWFYIGSVADVDTADVRDTRSEPQGESQVIYKRQTTYTNKNVDKGVTETHERNTVEIDTSLSVIVNEDISSEKGTNTVRGLRNVAFIVGLCVLLVVALIVLVITVKRFIMPKIF